MKRFSVEDMSCEHCVGTITRVIEDTDPDATVSVDLAGKVVAIQSTVSNEQLRQAMGSAGYEAEPLA
ncbi:MULTISPECIES: heavy-metal-associated domain-containing protein [Salinisphaera]|jgi:copper chaperone|uniref:heavy-metal-associated domain-containing protein n=1 Tax=Salinisphaera TaxID=180541 RepID=UPI000C36F1D0|nr:heavy-metal-associated domain-containing protein [Salinisphaera sp.]MBS63117.1 hypothetical protein [Salinisphaera sp.]